MKSFHGDIEIKNKYVARLKAHAAADEIIQGKGWENGKGCAVGCTLEFYDHASYESELGIPEWLARLEDAIFEGLSNEKAKQFAVSFLESIPIGVDLNPIKWKFCAFVLRENINRVLSLRLEEDLKEMVVGAIRQCLLIHENSIATNQWNKSAAESAAWSARSAAGFAESAARSAAWSTRFTAEFTAESAWSAARSAWSAAESAAWSTAGSAGSAAGFAAGSAESAESAAGFAAGSAESAESAESARFAAFTRYADKIVELLKEAI